MSCKIVSRESVSAVAEILEVDTDVIDFISTVIESGDTGLVQQALDTVAYAWGWARIADMLSMSPAEARGRLLSEGADPIAGAVRLLEGLTVGSVREELGRP